MAKKANVKTVKNAREKRQENIVLTVLSLPMLLWIALIPSIIKRYNELNPLKGKVWYYTQDYISDFFLYYKAKWIVITAILMIVALIVAYIIEREVKLQKKDLFIFIPLALYGVMAILSSCFSEYKHFAIHGCPDQYESIFVLLSYLVGTYYFYHVFRYYSVNKIFIGIEVVSCILVQIVCMSQFICKDIYKVILKGVSFTFEEGRVYGSFYNVDYVGVYMIIILPLFVLLVIYSKMLWLRVTAAILSIAMVLSVIASDTTTSILAMVVVLGLAILAYLLKILKSEKAKKVAVRIIAVLMPITFLIGIPVAISVLAGSKPETHPLEHMYTRDEYIEMVYNGQTYYISNKRDEDLNFTLIVEDENHNHLGARYITEEESSYFEVDDDNIRDLKITPEIVHVDPIRMGLSITTKNKRWIFSNEMGDNTYYYLTAEDCYDKITEENESDTFGPLVGKERFGSRRGFIWSKAVTVILNNNIILGSGPDSFVMTFPNDDYVALSNNGYGNSIITKPHCIFMQMAAQTGLISLIGFLVFFVWYFFDSLNIYIRAKFDDMKKVIGFAAFLGTSGYIFMGIVNDSTVTAAFHFWAMMGVGIAINALVKEGMKDTEKSEL